MTGAYRIVDIVASPDGLDERFTSFADTNCVDEGFRLLTGYAFSGNRDILHHLSELQLKKAKSSKDQQRLCRAVNRIARVTCLDSLDDNSKMKKLCEQAYEISQNLL